MTVVSDDGLVPCYMSRKTRQGLVADRSHQQLPLRWIQQLDHGLFI
jgi:hypothetical protein